MISITQIQTGLKDSLTLFILDLKVKTIYTLSALFNSHFQYTKKMSQDVKIVKKNLEI